jgi:hypothetical protein
MPVSQERHHQVVAAVLEGVCPDCRVRLVPYDGDGEGYGTCTGCGWRWHATVHRDGSSTFQRKGQPDPETAGGYPYQYSAYKPGGFLIGAPGLGVTRATHMSFRTLDS